MQREILHLGGKKIMGEILINQLFAGAYLQEGTNIGHEVINLFRDDNDENYLYITPMRNDGSRDEGGRTK